MDASALNPEMDPSAAYSRQRKAGIDDMVQRGEEEFLRFTLLSAVHSMTAYYTNTPPPHIDIEMRLHDLWYTCIQAAKNMVSGEEKQDTLIRSLLAAKALGPLRPGSPSDSGDADQKTAESVTASSSESYTIWSELPLLHGDLIDEFTNRYFDTSSYDIYQRANLAGFLGRLISVGIYDGPDICILTLFRETLEVSRPLVSDGESEQISLEDLTGALEEMAQNSIFGLAVLASKHRVPMITNMQFDGYRHFCHLGELASQAGRIPPFGYSRERWAFWIQRLEELSKCGVEIIQSNAEGCLSPMTQAQDDTRLL